VSSWGAGEAMPAEDIRPPHRKRGDGGDCSPPYRW
jgi:hypothetical protein